MDECLIVLFVWIITRPSNCFHLLDVIVVKQLDGIKAGPRWVFTVY